MCQLLTFYYFILLLSHLSFEMSTIEDGGCINLLLEILWAGGGYK